MVLKNERGTAPGMLFEKNGKIFVSMPGVPHEMKGIMAEHVIPLIAEKYQTEFLEHRTLLTAGIGESYLADLIEDFETALPSHIKLAYLPNYGMVRLRLSAYGSNKASLQQEINHQFFQLKSKVFDYLVIDEDIPLQAAVGKLLSKRKQTVSTAESCTGGYIAHLLTSVSGASDYYTGGVVSYENSIKQNVLHVKEETLQSFGAVSEEVVKEMATNVLALMKTDYAIATSGIMGPTGGTNDKPVGTVWIAVTSKTNIITQKFFFRFDRERNIQLTAINALNLLRQIICQLNVDNS